MRTAQIEDPKPDKPCDVRYGEMHMFLGRNFIVTVRHGYATSFSQVRTRAESTPDLLEAGSGLRALRHHRFHRRPVFPHRRCARRGARSRSNSACSPSPSAGSTTTQIYKLKRDLIALKRVVAPVIEIVGAADSAGG